MAQRRRSIMPPAHPINHKRRLPMKFYELPGEQRIPALGLGTWKSAPGAVYAAVKEAIAIGYRHIDCAPAYQNEPEVGKAVAESLASGIMPRQDLWLTSKLWNNAHEPEQVQPALEKTLADLQVAYLDLYLIHWPVLFKSGVMFPRQSDDYLTLDAIPVSETWKALEACVGKGLVRNIGVCNFSIKKLDALCQKASIRPVMNQIELHPYLQQCAMLEYCRYNNILLTAYSPLGSSDRPAGMKKPDEPTLLDHSVIQGIATKHGATPGQVLLSWGLCRQTVVIPKSVNPDRLRQNLAATELTLDLEDMTAIAALDRGYRFVDGSFFEGPGSPYTVKELWDE
jgi:alcohol dehydrogenase (NADP+)